MFVGALSRTATSDTRRSRFHFCGTNGIPAQSQDGCTRTEPGTTACENLGKGCQSGYDSSCLRTLKIAPASVSANPEATKIWPSSHNGASFEKRRSENSPQRSPLAEVNRKLNFDA